MTNELSERDDVDIDALPLAQDRGVGWQALRDAGAVCPAGESFILTSADAVDEAAKAPTVFSSRRAFDRLGSPLALIPIGTDPPDHTRYRRLLDPFFSPKRMAEREPQLRQSAAELIDAIAVRGQCELITDLATPYPSDVFLGLFGLPLRDRDRLNQWKDSILEFTSPSATKPSPEVLTHALELFTYLSEHITRRRQDNSGDDLLTRLIKTRDEGGLSDEDILGLCFLFVLAGLDTVTAALGFAFGRLAQDPSLRRQLAEDESLIPAFIEELLRTDGPVPFAPRVTTEDVEVDGILLPKDTTVLMSYGCANRDPDRYDDADELHVGERVPHFAFGKGPHRCLGSHLARMELRIILEEWHRRIPEYSLADGFEPQVLWPSGTLGLDAVPLVFMPPSEMTSSATQRR
ncbi:cytochrome P450 [Williamsia sp. DF01-3]|uniref:cytochrome P450 n=1 Tax=Williamsia sp. DF01-3 TaxID=2934157 RepID=UPI001FF4791E|nr:cytochrome P450 [Williamsia sp. DF01-3]MCK0516685.1 cytochrome P450 [Williamsia sp. DF01-3]